MYDSSKKFKEAVDSLDFTLDFEPDESTYRLDCLFAKIGISSFHNVNIYNIPFRLEELKHFGSIFYTFKAENTTEEVEKNLGVIYENYPENCIVKNQFSSETGKFERENKDEIKTL